MWAESKRPTSCFHIAGRRCVHLFLYRNDSFSVCGVVCVVASALASRAVRLFPVRRERNGQLLLPTRRALHWLCFVSESASSSSSVSVTPPLSFFESRCELFFCFGDEKKKNSVRWFWQRWCNCAGEILEVDCCEQCERLSYLTYARERTLTGRKGKKEKKNAQSQESLLTVFSLCADYVPLFLFFLEFSNIWDPFWQVVFLFFFVFLVNVTWLCRVMLRWDAQMYERKLCDSLVIDAAVVAMCARMMWSERNALHHVYLPGVSLCLKFMRKIYQCVQDFEVKWIFQAEIKLFKHSIHVCFTSTDWKRMHIACIRNYC